MDRHISLFNCLSSSTVSLSADCIQQGITHAFLRPLLSNFVCNISWYLLSVIGTFIGTLILDEIVVDLYNR